MEAGNRPTTTTTTTGSYCFHPRLPDLPITERTARILWRDIIFLILGAVALLFVSFVEKNAADAVSTVFHQIGFILGDMLHRIFLY